MARREIYNTIDCKERILLAVTGKDEYGGYKQDLLENDLDEMEIDFCVCVKCNGVMRNACLVNGPDQLLVCEVCNIEREDSIPIIKVRKNISELRAKCPLMKRGCVWKGSLGEIDAHLDDCTEFILNCSNLCGVLMKRSELQNHCENECQLRIVECKYCGAGIQCKELENHYRICLEFPLLCPNECLKSVIRKGLKSHIERECPNTLVACPYKEMGCGVLCKRSELPKHEKIFELNHFDATKIFYFNKVEKMETIIQNQKDEIEQLTAKVRTKEKECQRLRISESPVLALTTPSIEVDELTEPIKVNSGPSELRCTNTDRIERIPQEMGNGSISEKPHLNQELTARLSIVNEENKNISSTTDVPVNQPPTPLLSMDSGGFSIPPNRVVPMSEIDSDGGKKHYFYQLKPNAGMHNTQRKSPVPTEYSEYSEKLATPLSDEVEEQLENVTGDSDPSSDILLAEKPNSVQADPWSLEEQNLPREDPKEELTSLALPQKSVSLIQNYSTVQHESDNNEPRGQEMKFSKLKIIFLDSQGIFNNRVYSTNILRWVKYYEFVHLIYEILRKEKREINFTSVELYSETGYPLAPTPSIYLQPLSNWGLRDNDLIYAYPKKLFNKYMFECDIDCKEFVISIQLKDSDIRKEFIFNQEYISCFDLKIRISLDMHILTDCINIHYFNLKNQCEEIAPECMDIQEEFINKKILSFTISDTYFNNKDEFHLVYTSYFPSSSLPKCYTLNADIQDLVREYGENRNKDRLLRKLGLLRKISCSPPLVYSLYLLFTQSPTSLPHRIAINEGIITTISILEISNIPTISTFPQLWMHIEELALAPDLQFTFTSKLIQETPSHRFLEPLFLNPDTIITELKIPSIYAIHNYSKIMIILDLSSEMSLTFEKPNPAPPHRDAAIKVIETLIDYLTSSQCKYLLGCIVISNNPKVQYGYSEIIKPTIEYGEVLKEIKSFIHQDLKPAFYLRNEPTEDLIVSLLDCCIDLYATPSENLRTEIFLFTNSESRIKYNGPEENNFKRKLRDSFCVFDNFTLSDQYSHNLEELSKLTKGVHVTYKSILKCLSNENCISAPTISVLKGMLSVSGQDANFGTYDFLSTQLAGQLISIEEFLENFERGREEYQTVMAYIESQSPHCKLYNFRNEIQKWIVFMQGPIDSPFEGSILILELNFGEQYPHYPPKLRFLSSVYHPNVDNTGHICHPILIEDYSPSVSLRQILDAIHAMLAQPIISHAVRSKVLETAQWNVGLYNNIVNTFCETLSLKGKTLSTIEQDFKI